MKIIIGLGNPGESYKLTKHNSGWIFLDYLEKKYTFNIQKKTLESKIAEINLEGEKVVFVKPQTYMNLSGNAVTKVKNWYKVAPKDMIVIFDDIDIPFGEIRYKENGSGGTHNGMKHIIQMLGTNEIARIRIGIGGLKHEKQDLADFVLQKFTKEQLEILENEVFVKAEEKLLEFLRKS